MFGFNYINLKKNNRMDKNYLFKIRQNCCF